MDELSEKGFHRVDLRDIAARAEVNKQLISYHFGGKENPLPRDPAQLAGERDHIHRSRAVLGGKSPTATRPRSQNWTDGGVGNSQEPVLLGTFVVVATPHKPLGDTRPRGGSAGASQQSRIDRYSLFAF
ncbi:TetR family transcriptional regulator [Nocardia sp. NPDC047038]|uniref:TetR family transcriptional regulator n=1 Tax=Nocardia sp. NPDC047038 TaxID=3154338 RepID=UPI0033D2148C